MTGRRKRWLIAAWRFIVLAFAATVPRDPAQAQDACPIPPPLAQVEAHAIYSDLAGSQLDPSGLHRNQELIRPLRGFTELLTRQVDGDARQPTQDDLDCATKMLGNWAAAGALLQQPASFPAVRERQRFGLGITLAALKLRALGRKLDAGVVAWLHALDTAVVDDFVRRRMTDNLAVWSGANAASLAMIDGDQDARQYESMVWQEALRQIDAQGFVPSELRRKSRALLYHQYYASALLFLRRLRSGLGQSSTAGDQADLRRLVDRVETSLCDPEAMVRASGGYTQEPPPAAHFAVGLVFGDDIIDKRWTRCGTKPIEMRDPTLGGQLDRTFALPERLGSHDPAGKLMTWFSRVG